MRSPFANLNVALTFAVPTLAAVLGFLWLFLRKKDEDDPDTGSVSTASETGMEKLTISKVQCEEAFISKLKISGDGSGDTVGEGKIALPSSEHRRPEENGDVKTVDTTAGGMLYQATESILVSEAKTLSTEVSKHESKPAVSVLSKAETVLSTDMVGLEAGAHGVHSISSEEQLKEDDAAIVHAMVCPSSSAQSSLNFSHTSSNELSALDCKEDVARQIVKDVAVARQIMKDVAVARQVVKDVAVVKVSEVQSTEPVSPVNLVQSESFEADQKGNGSSEPDQVPSVNLAQSESTGSNQKQNNFELEQGSKVNLVQLKSFETYQKGNSGIDEKNHQKNIRDETQPKCADSGSSSKTESKVLLSTNSTDVNNSSSELHACSANIDSSLILTNLADNSCTNLEHKPESLSTSESRSGESQAEAVKKDKPVAKVPPAKAAKPNRDICKAPNEQRPEKLASGSKESVSHSSPSAGRKSPSLNSKQPQEKEAEKQSVGQLTAGKSTEQNTQSEASSSDTPCSRLRTTSGASDRTSEPKRDDPDSAGHSSGVSENGRLGSSGSPGCDTNSEASNDSGHGGSVGDSLIPLHAGELVRYEFNFPSDLCGRLIGRGGKNIQNIKQQSGATVTLSSNPFTPEYQICQVTGVQSEVEMALATIRKKFPQSRYPRLDMTSLMPPPPPAAPVLLPELMQHALQLSLPDGVSMGIVVSAVVNAGHIFVQQPAHPSFPSLESLNQFMNVCYSDPDAPSLPRPVEGGIICATESEGQWYRAQIVQVYPDTDECDIKFVDYGGYIRVAISMLKQIRSDFMTLPFQAIECYLANISPLQDEEYFSDKAAEVLSELTAGKMLQGQVICRGEDSICYVHLYQVSGNSVLLINREMVNKEIARWIEIL